MRCARRQRWLLALLLLGGVVAACGGGAGRHDVPHPPSGELRASAGQFRFDEGTRNMPTGITNNSREPITVTSAKISWDGFHWSVVKVPREPVMPGQTAAFVSHFGRADCAAKPPAPRLLAVVNGVRRDLALHVDEPGLFERLQQKVCAEQRLAEAAALRMSIGRSVVRGHGMPHYAGRVVLRRAQVPGEPVTVVDLGGSILFDVRPEKGRRLRPMRLSPGTASLTVPIRVSPTRRCEAHARGNTSQPFLFSVFTRTGDGPVHRTITVPDKATQLRLWRLLDQHCARVGNG